MRHLNVRLGAFFIFFENCENYYRKPDSNSKNTYILWYNQNSLYSYHLIGGRSSD